MSSDALFGFGVFVAVLIPVLVVCGLPVVVLAGVRRGVRVGLHGLAALLVLSCVGLAIAAVLGASGAAPALLTG